MARKFSQKKLDQFRTHFLAKRDQIFKSIKSADNAVDDDGDEVDAVQALVLTGIANQLSQRDVRTIEKISASLEKIDSGDFGSCEECGERIGEQRLLAVPGVEFCINCAEEQERQAKQFR